MSTMRWSSERGHIPAARSSDTVALGPLSYVSDAVSGPYMDMDNGVKKCPTCFCSHVVLLAVCELLLCRCCRRCNGEGEKCLPCWFCSVRRTRADAERRRQLLPQNWQLTPFCQIQSSST